MANTQQTLASDRSKRIAVLIPCLNEAPNVGNVVDEFRRLLPDAAIYVVDNGSTDDTAAVARAHGAEVIAEATRGKGNAVRTAFRVADADYYVLIDGDDTCPTEAVTSLLVPVLTDKADMVVGSRFMKGAATEIRPLNRVGNQCFSWLMRLLLNARVTDLLSGYRVMNHALVKHVPLTAQGFEIDAELTFSALRAGYRVVEGPTGLRDRPNGTQTKIRVVQDGLRILRTLVLLRLRGAGRAPDVYAADGVGGAGAATDQGGTPVGGR